MKTRTLGFALLCLLVAAPAVARAAEDRGDDRRPRRAPPQEALDACSSIAVDEACRFTFEGRAHEGVCCRGPGGQGPLACAPRRGPPPPEAVAACAQLAADQACQFTFDGRHHEGVCRRGPDGQGSLACAPHRGSGHGGQDAAGPDRGPGQGQGQARP
jgi:hypothetical protein